MQEGIPLKRNDAMYVCLERVLVELSVHMGMLLVICCDCDALRNPASTLGMAGFDVP